jgi:two-component system, chemotaxis family, protein-glutamate methylesterase/glutaminase
VPKQDIVVIGASAGGVEALQTVAAGLPAGLDASVFVVLHIGAGINGHSMLPEILSKAGALPASHPSGVEEIRHGRIYVARPDCHMILTDRHVQAVHGLKENRTRPAINPLFRSAAAAYGPRVAGVILTGLQDDGVSGLAEIKRQGGVAVVQDPSTALFQSMPNNAIGHVDTDFIVPLEQVAGVISTLATTDRIVKTEQEPMKKTLLEIKCPECAGPLWEERQGLIVEYRCRVGHAYSPLALIEEQEDVVEKTLWSSVIALQNAAKVTEALAETLGPNSAEDVRQKRAQAEAIREMLDERQLSDK